MFVVGLIALVAIPLGGPPALHVLHRTERDGLSAVRVGRTPSRPSRAIAIGCLRHLRAFCVPRSAHASAQPTHRKVIPLRPRPPHGHHHPSRQDREERAHVHRARVGKAHRAFHACGERVVAERRVARRISAGLAPLPSSLRKSAAHIRKDERNEVRDDSAAPYMTSSASLSARRAKTATSPWLTIPLADYERHMSLTKIAQSRMIADEFESALREHAPSSVAVVGCSGGNGFDRIDPRVTKRVVGIDINPDYVSVLRRRFSRRIPSLELWVGDIESARCPLRPVDLVYAALLLEYVEVTSTLKSLRSLLRPGGILRVLLQLPSRAVPEISPSPFLSLQSLSAIFKLRDPAQVRSAAASCGLTSMPSHKVALRSRKRFEILDFQEHAYAP